MKTSGFRIYRLVCSVFLFGVFSAAGLLFSSGSAAKTRTKAESVTSGTIVPQYQIFDIGVVQSGDSNAQGVGVSPNGMAVGRSIRTGAAQAFFWRQAGGLVGLPNLAGRAFCVSNGANDSGIVAGTCAATLFGTSRLPVIWQNGAVSQLNMPAGETLGDANDINSSGVVVGSVNSGSQQKALYFSGGVPTLISQTTAGGSFFNTAFGINDSGRIVGTGIDPQNAARNVGMVYEIGAGFATEVGALPGANGALAFGVSNSGFVVGSSMMNQGSGLPYRWSESGGMIAIPLPAGTSQGSARGVNSQGWAVGTASSAFAIPFVYDGSATYRVADLIPAGTGWDLSTNTSSSALGISDTNIIVGSGVLNGQVRAYVMIPDTTGVIEGRVQTANGTGIRSAIVTISGGNLAAPITVKTATFGQFSFRNLHQGAPFRLSVASKRFSFGISTYAVRTSGGPLTLNFIADEQ